MPRREEFPPPDEIFSELDNDHSYASWLMEGDPDLEESELVGAIGIAVRANKNGQQLFHRPSFIGGSGLELTHNRDAFLEGYRVFHEDMADPGIRTFGTFKRLHETTVMRRTERALARAHLSLLGAYTVFRSDVGSEYSRFLEVSEALIRQSTSAASEFGLVKRDHDYARSVRGRLSRHKPLEQERYGELIAQALLFGLLPKPENVLLGDSN
jgi:hypothetical protein